MNKLQNNKRCEGNFLVHFLYKLLFKKSLLFFFTENDIFHVRPAGIRIFPNCSGMFEFCFTPQENYRFYKHTLVAQVYWEETPSNLQHWEVPITTQVTLAGEFE